MIKIFYNLSKEFTDEPKFEEVRISAGRIVKVKNLQGNEFYAKITKIPIGMLSRKEKDKSDIEERNNVIANTEANCMERHLEELPGFIEVELLFDKNKILLESTKKVSLPVCLIQLISNKDELVFEKILLKNENYQKINNQNELNLLFEEYEKLQRHITEPKSLNELMLEEAKITLNKIQHITPAQLENIAKTIEDNDENINVLISLFRKSISSIKLLISLFQLSLNTSEFYLLASKNNLLICN